MFKNLKVTAKMRTQVCFSEYLRFDCILSAAKAKDILADTYYSQGKQCGSVQLVVDTLSKFLKFNEKLGVFHASCAISDNEFVTAYSKRWNSGLDRAVAFKGKGRAEIDTARGFFKAYRNPLVYHVMPEIVFYAVGDKAEIERLLQNIAYLGKKSSQGYGEVAEWEIEVIDEDKSIFNNGKIARIIPALAYVSNEHEVTDDMNVAECAVIPPAYRKEKMDCFVP